MVDIGYILRDDSGHYTSDEYEMAAELKILRGLAKETVPYILLRAEHDAHPWEVGAVSVMNRFQRVFDYIHDHEELRQYD